MPYASCQRCQYQCQLAEHLSGKHIRCPKCSAVVRVVDEKPVANDAGRTGVMSAVGATTGSLNSLFVGEGEKRRGPISIDQLQLLAKWDLVAYDALVTDEVGQRRASVKTILDNKGWPAPGAKRSSAEINTFNPRTRRLSTYASRMRFSPFARLQAPKAKDAPPEITEEERQKGLADADFVTLLDRAVQMERNAATVEMKMAEAGMTRQQIADRSDMARFIRSDAFEEGFIGMSTIYLVCSFFFTFATCAVSGMFLKRLLGLSLSVFVPFESTEQIDGEPLLAAGVSLVFVIAQILLPIWFLLRSDGLPWVAIAASGMGLLLGMGLQPGGTWMLFEIVRWVTVLCGIALVVVSIRMLNSSGSDAVYSRLLAAIIFTSFATIALAVIRMNGVLDIQLKTLPPLLSGSKPHAAIFAASFYTFLTAVPAFLLWILYPEGTDAIKSFLTTHVLAAGIFGLIGMGFTGLLMYPQNLSFLGCALALLPLCCGNIIITVLPALLWMIHPAYLLRGSNSLR